MRLGTLVPLFALLSASCATVAVGDRMVESREAACPRVLEEEAAVRADPEYAAESPTLRRAYEAKVARCLLVAGRPSDAVALATTWADGSDERLEIEARASAVLGRHDDARAALERLAASSTMSPRVFVLSPELAAYRGQPWFVEAGLSAWSPASGGKLEPFVSGLLGKEAALLSLDLAAADAERPEGDWAVWTGVVRSARLDRSQDRTILEIEGVVIDDELRLLDRKVESVEVRPSYKAHRGVESVPKYSTEKHYEEVARPSGLTFVAHVPGASEALVGLRTVIAVGRYGGRAEAGGPPLLWTIAVVERPLEERVVRE